MPKDAAYKCCIAANNNRVGNAPESPIWSELQKRRIEIINRGRQTLERDPYLNELWTRCEKYRRRVEKNEERLSRAEDREIDAETAHERRKAREYRRLWEESVEHWEEREEACMEPYDREFCTAEPIDLLRRM